MNAHRFALFVRLLVSFAAYAFALGAAAHGNDPLERVPAPPGAAVPVEQASGEVHRLTVVDRVLNATIRYHWLALDGGEGLLLRGAAAEGLSDKAVVEVTGQRLGRTFFVGTAREMPGTRKGARAAGAVTEAEGELRLIHVDYLEAERTRFELEIVDDRGNVIPLGLPVRPEALQRGMRVRARGPTRADGTIEPDTIEILSLARSESSSKVDEKATVTNNVLVILIRFADSGAQPFTQAQVQSTFAGGAGSASVTEYFREASYGKQLLNATVTPWLSSASATPANCDFRTMGALARTAATAAGYNVAAYQNLVYVFPRVSSCGWSGLAYVGASGVWSNGNNNLLVYAHELGHNFGLLHAGSLDCGAIVIGGSCSGSEYGDPFSVMGNQRAMHYNAAQKSLLGWFGSGGVATHSGGAVTYTLNPLEASGGSTYALKVRAAPNRTYWLEYRQPIGFDAGMAGLPNNGAQVRVAAPFESICNCDTGSEDTQILDMTPSTSSFSDGALVAGRSFTDPAYGVTFNVLSATSAGLTVQVVSGGTLAATTTALASSLNPSLAGAIVTFTATVTGAAPGGTVAFTSDGASIAGCAAVSLAGSGNARTAACTTGSLAAGTHAVAARYGGDAANQASSSPSLSQVVNAAPAPTGTNVALASAGATASASSVAGAAYAAAGVINGERAGANWGSANAGWKDGTADVWPDWVQVDFSGSKAIDRVVVFSVQDNWTAPVEPTDTMTFSQWGVRDFTVQGWNGTSWVTLATVNGNTLVKRTVTFASFTTDRIRVNVTNALASATRITEVQAWGTAATASASNVALASAGATSTSSSNGGSAFLPAGVIDNERTGTGWVTTNAGWKDGTLDTFPDWIQVTFNGSKAIDRVVVFSIQDNWTAPVEPTDTMTFSQWGIRDFAVQGWNGAAWVTLGTVSGNSLVKRTVTFPVFVTDRIRVNVTNALGGSVRMTELQAWGTAAASLAQTRADVATIIGDAVAQVRGRRADLR